MIEHVVAVPVPVRAIFEFTAFLWDLNLLKQPSGNGTDCGVLICLYMWSFIAGMPWPSPFAENVGREQREVRRIFSQLMNDARVNIGAHIASEAVNV